MCKKNSLKAHLAENAAQTDCHERKVCDRTLMIKKIKTAESNRSKAKTKQNKDIKR